MLLRRSPYNVPFGIRLTVTFPDERFSAERLRS